MASRGKKKRYSGPAAAENTAPAPPPDERRAAIAIREWLKVEWVRFLAGMALVLLCSSLQTWNAWRIISNWQPHVGGDTPTYVYYSLHVFSGQPYAEYISDAYSFRTPGYPWLLWQVLHDESPKNMPSAGYSDASQMKWALQPLYYRNLVKLQAATGVLVPACGYVIGWLLTRSLLHSLLIALAMMMFPGQINYARWVIPDSLTIPLHVLAMAGVAATVYAKRWWQSAVAAMATGLLIFANVMLRLNFLVIVPVLWIGLGIVAVGLGWARIRDRRVWLRLALVGLGITIPYTIAMKSAVAAKQAYSGATELSDGMARMGGNVAARYYERLDPAELAPEVEAVRQHMLSLPPPPADPRDAYPAVMYYMNKNAQRMGISPWEFRERLAELNLAVIKDRPFYWFSEHLLPAWREEMMQSGVGRDSFRMIELRLSPGGALFYSGRQIQVALSYLIDPTLMYIAATLYVLVLYRVDWRAALVILVLIGGHFASVLVSAIMGISAMGRYRISTEPAGVVVLTVALIHLVSAGRRGVKRLKEGREGARALSNAGCPSAGAATNSEQ